MNNPIIFTNVYDAYEIHGVTTRDFVIFDLTLSINQGEFFCLVGPSGCGKSTILKMIAGIEIPDKGTLVKPDHIGMVFQSGALLPWLTAFDNVSFAAQMQGVEKEKAKKLAHHYLEMVHLEKFMNKYPRELSGGQRQRVGIARALIIESDVLLMDEPFSALDPLITDELHKDILAIWRETQKTIVMVSHNFEEAVTLADRIGIIKEGKLKTIIPITLPRPRKEEEKSFMNEVEKIRNVMEQ